MLLANDCPAIALRYDRASNTLTITFSNQPVARTLVERWGIRVGMTARNGIAVIAIHQATRVVDRRVLVRLTSPDEFLTLREAAREANLSPTTLRVQIHYGRIAAVKRGRDWLLHRDELRDYLALRGVDLG